MTAAPELTLEPAFSAIEARLAGAVGEIASGGNVDLDGLNDAVERLCRAALIVPGADRKAILARFERLSRAVDWLRRSLAASEAA